MKPSDQVHFRILRAIESQPDITQRELAQQLGVSKGKTNYLIAALIEKGLIKIGNFQRGEDKLGKIAYLIKTSSGITPPSPEHAAKHKTAIAAPSFGSQDFQARVNPLSRMP